MTTMKAVWSRRAVQRLVPLREYLARDSEQSAALMAKLILDAVGLLKAQAELGQPSRTVDTRELLVQETPYIIPYRIRVQPLELIPVLHGRQKWRKML